MIDNEKLIKAANSNNGKLIIEHLKGRIEELDLNKIAADDLCSIEKIKATAIARKILDNEIRLLTGDLKEADSILNYLT